MRQTDSGRGGAFAPLSTSYRVHWQPAERVDQRSTSALPLPFRAPREIARRALKQKCCPLRGNGFLICCARWEVLRERHENERARVHFLLKFTLAGEQMNRSKNSFSLSISRETPPAHDHPRLVRLHFQKSLQSVLWSLNPVRFNTCIGLWITFLQDFLHNIYDNTSGCVHVFSRRP